MGFCSWVPTKERGTCEEINVAAIQQLPFIPILGNMPFLFGFKNLVVDDENVGVFAEILTPCGDIPMIKKLNTGMMLSY
jgi:hypothetical protein